MEYELVIYYGLYTIDFYICHVQLLFYNYLVYSMYVRLYYIYYQYKNQTLLNNVYLGTGNLENSIVL